MQKDEQLQATNQTIKTVAAKVIQAFELIEEYNTLLFIWYYKGFELLRRYLVKHHSGVNLEDLDFKKVDKEMEAEESSQSAATTEENVPKDHTANPEGAPTKAVGRDEATA